jgi:hypothetical protein
MIHRVFSVCIISFPFLCKPKLVLQLRILLSPLTIQLFLFRFKVPFCMVAACDNQAEVLSRKQGEAKFFD